MTERYKVVGIEEEGARWVGVVKEDNSGPVSAVSVRISQNSRTPVSIGFHGTTPGIGTTELDRCDMLGGHCHFDDLNARILGLKKKFPKTDRGQVRFLTKALRREERIEERQRRLWVESLLGFLQTRAASV